MSTISYTYIIPGLLALTLLTLLAVYVYYRYLRRRYTRERFAFVGVATLASVMLTAFGVLMVQNPLSST